MRADLVGEWMTVGMGVDRLTRSSEKSFRVAGLIKDSDSVRGLEVDLAGSMKDQAVYSRSWIRSRYW